MRSLSRYFGRIARALSAAGALTLILGTCPAQRFNWLGPVEVRSVSNGGLIVGKMVDMNGQTRALRRMRLRYNEPQPTLGGAHSEAWGVTHNGRVLVGFATDSNGRIRAYRQTPNELQDLGVLGGGPYAWSEARDVAQDGCVDDADLLAALFAFGTEALIRTPHSFASYLLRHEDLNYDGIVDGADLLIVLFNFGSGC